MVSNFDPYPYESTCFFMDSHMNIIGFPWDNHMAYWDMMVSKQIFQSIYGSDFLWLYPIKTKDFIRMMEMKRMIS
jgi:hypothetical protein